MRLGISGTSFSCPSRFRASRSRCFASCRGHFPHQSASTTFVKCSQPGSAQRTTNSKVPTGGRGGRKRRGRAEVPSPGAAGVEPAAFPGRFRGRRLPDAHRGAVPPAIGNLRPMRQPRGEPLRGVRMQPLPEGPRTRLRVPFGQVAAGVVKGGRGEPEHGRADHQRTIIEKETCYG